VIKKEDPTKRLIRGKGELVEECCVFLVVRGIKTVGAGEAEGEEIQRVR